MKEKATYTVVTSMNKTMLIAVGVLAMIVGGFFAINSSLYTAKQGAVESGVVHTNVDSTPVATTKPTDTIPHIPPVLKADEPVACQMDAKICPDGSGVGRTGPTCEFAACPSPAATSSRTTTYLGGTVTTMNLSVSPKAIVSDSRCPQGVTCVWAGTVEVRTVLSTQVSQGGQIEEYVLTLGKPQKFGNYRVTLVGVTPAKSQTAIPDSSYRFTFEIAKL